MLKINEDCISCGICKAVCPAQIIELKEGRPVITADYCIRCGHCDAACPKGALENELLGQEKPLTINEYPVLDSEKAELFLRSRRSIRCFKETEVAKAETEKLLDIGRYAQTGSNSQGVSYMVLNKETTAKLRALTLEFYQKQENEMMQYMYQSFINSDRDRLFRGAPMCILALTDRQNPYTKRNAQFALTYIELMAPSLGLGTCWAGYLEQYTATDDEALRALLELPEEYQISGALLYGYPKYRYYKTTTRNEGKILWR